MMIADYLIKIKISEHQRAKWENIVKFRPGHSTIFTFYPDLTK